MSYNYKWDTGPMGPAPGLDYGLGGGLGALDIAVLQQRYGTNGATASGDDVYTLPDANGAGAFYAAIWDTGGQDEIRASGEADATISLVAATLDYSPTGGGVVSYMAGVHGGRTIAAGVVIENATGAAGDDSLTGNGAANRLTGSAGDDAIDGGDGVDSAVFSGDRRQRDRDRRRRSGRPRRRRHRRPCRKLPVRRWDLRAGRGDLLLSRRADRHP
jgi:Ca2+-binding RTX toxin-like protein